MNLKPKHQRLILISLSLMMFGLAGFLVLKGLEDQVIYFYSPGDMLKKQIKIAQKVRLGGMVEKDSVQKKGLNVTFKITDFSHTLTVKYQGILPDLFREGQGVVVEGSLIRSDIFQAHTVLAKHDETYMPPEVAKSLKEKK